jgi:hypothetical protein
LHRGLPCDCHFRGMSLRWHRLIGKAGLDFYG